MCHITKITSVWRALVDLSKSSVCICSLRISGFAGLTALHLSNPAICICRQVISTLLLEQRWISPKKSFVFSKSNHLHFHSGDIHICQSLLFSSLLINQNSPSFGWSWDVTKHQICCINYQAAGIKTGQNLVETKLPTTFWIYTKCQTCLHNVPSTNQKGSIHLGRKKRELLSIDGKILPRNFVFCKCRVRGNTLFDTSSRSFGWSRPAWG